MKGNYLSRWWRAALIALLVGSVGTSCAPFRFLYISLEEVPGIEVDKRATPNLGGLYFSSDMPDRYSLDRERYRLRFQVPPRSYLPAMQIAVESKNGKELYLSHQNWRKARKDRQSPCGSFQAPGTSEGELEFMWATCVHEAADEQYISFDVLEKGGRVVGREDIPFKLKTNGICVVPDLL